MYDKTPYFYGTGRINDRDIDDYFGLETLKLIVRQPLALTETDEKFDIVCRVSGGGVTGQAGAIRHGISRALLQYDTENLRGKLKSSSVLKEIIKFILLISSEVSTSEFLFVLTSGPRSKAPAAQLKTVRRTVFLTLLQFSKR